MQLYFFKDSFTIYHIKAGKRIFSLGHNLIEILEFPFLFLLFSFFFFMFNNFLQSKNILGLDRTTREM